VLEVWVLEVEVLEVGVRAVEVLEVGVRAVEVLEVGVRAVEVREVEVREVEVREAWELGLENLHILLKTHIVSLLDRHSNCVRYQTCHLGISNLFLQIVSGHICIPSS
jgi:hypothetical protein